MRFTLLTGSTPGNDMKLAVSRVEANRNFCNKIWQAARFVLGNLGDDAECVHCRTAARWTRRALLDAADRWILSRYHAPGGRGDASDRGLPVGRGRPPDLRVPVGRVLRLVHRDDARCACAARMPVAADAARRVLVYVLDGACACCTPTCPLSPRRSGSICRTRARR